jgi:hypothetical protein
MIEIKKIHKAFCKQHKIKYAAKNLVKDLSWNCFAVAKVLETLLKKEGKKARAVYGFWYGECLSKPKQPMHRHGWTVVGNEILDPTRFVFEGKKPYLFQGRTVNHPEYDEGMRLAKLANRFPFPIPGRGTSYNIQWSKQTFRFLSQLILENSDDKNKESVDPCNLNSQQLNWISNTDYLALGKYISEIYSKLIENELDVFIPLDYRKWWEAHKQKTLEEMTTRSQILEGDDFNLKDLKN